MLMGGCDRDNQINQLNAQIVSLTEKVNELQSENNAQDKKLSLIESLNDNDASLNKAVSEIRAQLWLDSIIKDGTSSVFFKIGEDGYSIVSYDLGILIIGLDSIKEFSSGVKVNFRIANPSSVTVNGINAKLSWKSKGSDKESSKEIKLKQSLKPGVWTNAEYVLNDIDFKDFDYVKIENIKHEGISAYTR